MNDTSPTKKWLAATAYLITAGFAAPWLWRFWTPLCNEACAELVVSSIYGLLAVAVLGSVALSILTCTGKLGVKWSLIAFAGFALGVATAALVITRAAAD